MLSRITVLGVGLIFCVAVTSAAWQAQPPANKGSQPGDKKAAQPGDKDGPRFDAARFVKDHDKNNDGKLSKDELPGTAQAEIKELDTNSDGFVTQEELQKHAAAMADHRPHLVEVFFYAIDVVEEAVTTDELQAAYEQLRKLDKNNDGKIEDAEVKTYREQRRKEQIDGIFTNLDRNKDGKVAKDEARGLWADDFGQLDKNNDGMLDRGEVEAACSLNARKPGKDGAA